MSARHQVKRLDRIFEEVRFFKTGPAEETDFLRSVRVPFTPAISPGQKSGMKSGPDVFADALVPRDAFVPRNVPFPECPLSLERSDSPRIRRPALQSSPTHIDCSQASVVSLPPVVPGASSPANSVSGTPRSPEWSQKLCVSRSSAGTRHRAGVAPVR